MRMGKSKTWEYGRIRHVRRAHALNSEKVRKDGGIYDDVENFARRHDTSVGDLVDKLLNNDFGQLRYSDPEYPF